MATLPWPTYPLSLAIPLGAAAGYLWLSLALDWQSVLSEVRQSKYLIIALFVAYYCCQEECATISDLIFGTVIPSVRVSGNTGIGPAGGTPAVQQ
jgi:hypothetical protein